MSHLQRIIPFGIAAALFVLTPASLLAAQPAKANVKITGRCAGDTISGRVAVNAPAGTKFTVWLLQRRAPRARWTTTNLSAAFTSQGGKKTSYPFQFDVSTFDANAYRLSVEGMSRRTVSRVIPAASCAPGLDVPEAPLALLLPLSLLGTASLLLVRRRTVA